MSIADYDLEAEIGRGAMGRVHRARHRPTGALRAIKIDLAPADPEITARLEREAEALARVGGEEIVPVHEAGVDRGRHYLVMGFMPGGSLAARLAKEGKLEWREVVSIALALAHGLARCHAAGIVHRDLKPANVLFDEQGRPRLGDFGLVRDLAAGTLTETGTLVGTPAYMPPEQLDGRKVGGKADVYALGVVLHELIAGELPFAKERSLLAMIEAKRKGRRSRLSVPGVPPGLDALLDRALAADPEERPTAASLARELEAALAVRPGRRFVPWLAALAGLVVVAIAASLRHAPPRPPPPPPSAPPPAPPSPPATANEGRRRALTAVEKAWRDHLYADAIAALGSGVEATDDPWMRALAADAFLEAGNVEKALTLANKVPAGSPGEARALSVLAFVHEARHDEDGRPYATKAIELDPSLARAWLAKGLAAQDAARRLPVESRGPLLDEALDAAKRAESLAPPCRALARVTRGVVAESVARSLGQNAERTSDPEMALDPFGGPDRRLDVDRREERLGSGEAFLLARARDHLDGAFVDHHPEELPEAARDARRAIALNPHRPFAHALLAKCDPAIYDEEMAKALELDSWEPWGLDWQILACANRQEWERTVELLLRREKRGSGTGYRTAVAGARAAQKRVAEALEILEHLPDDELNHSDAYRKGALLALGVNDFERAGRFARDAVGAYRQGDAERALSHLVQARVFLTEGDPDAAIKTLSKVVRPDESAAAVEAMCARAWLAKGDLAETVKALGRCCEQSPAFKEACAREGVDVGAAIKGAAPEDERAGLVRRALALADAPDEKALLHARRNWPLIGRIPVE